MCKVRYNSRGSCVVCNDRNVYLYNDDQAQLPGSECGRSKMKDDEFVSNWHLFSDCGAFLAVQWYYWRSTVFVQLLSIHGKAADVPGGVVAARLGSCSAEADMVNRCCPSSYLITT